MKHIRATRIFSLMFIVVSFSILVLLVPTVVQGDDGSTVFNPFADLLPGQTANVVTLEKQGFVCKDTIIPSPADTTQNCQKSLDNDSFSQMTISVWDGVVTEVNFSVRENALTVGDLALLYGAPQIAPIKPGISLEWPEAQVSASGTIKDEGFNYLMPLVQVSIRSA